MKPHKHCEVIKAWAEGAEVEFRKHPTDDWEVVSRPGWYDFYEYRVVEKRMYRLGFYIGATRNYVVAHQADSSEERQYLDEVQSTDFIRWLSDWTELPND